jgi:hypothetical protein
MVIFLDEVVAAVVVVDGTGAATSAGFLDFVAVTVSVFPSLPLLLLLLELVLVELKRITTGDLMKGLNRVGRDTRVLDVLSNIALETFDNNIMTMYV